MMNILFHQNKIDFIGLSLMVFFMIIAAFQMLGMVAHRLMTFGHIVSSRNIFGKKKAFDMKKVIEQSGVSIMKDMIQNIEVNTMISLLL